MLKGILRGGEQSQIVIIDDNLAESGVPLLKTFIKSLLLRFDKVHLFLLEYTVKDITDSLCDASINSLEVHELTKDPLGWHSNNSKKAYENLLQISDQIESSSAGKYAVVIDCISNLILHRDVPYTCKVLHRLAQRHKFNGGDAEQLVTLYHSDLHSVSVKDMLEHTASTWIKLYSPSQLDSYTGACHTTHKRASGKVQKIVKDSTREQFVLNQKFDLLEVDEVKTVQEIISSSDEKNPDPSANLTFNLTLSEKEKTARSQIVLPYIHDKKKQEATLERSVGEGKIFYQPDEADDFDEEDPDDDLDI